MRTGPQIFAFSLSFLSACNEHCFPLTQLPRRVKYRHYDGCSTALIPGSTPASLAPRGRPRTEMDGSLSQLSYSVSRATRVGAQSFCDTALK